MQKLKKPVSLLLSFVLLFSLLTIIPVSAAETDGEDVGADRREITYIEKNGSTATRDCLPFTKDTKVLEEDEWYYAEGTIENNNRVTARNNAHLILLNGADCKIEYGICVPTHVEQQDDGEIHIYGQTTDRSTMGRLTAKVGKGAGYAAIGSNYHRYDAGEIEINGGHIEAYAEYGAAIGSGETRMDYNFKAQRIEINGGYVHAHSIYGCGIGGGYASSVGTIEINGGTIVAESEKAAGIGAANNNGYEITSCGTIKINGGDITAKGATNAIGTHAYSTTPDPGFSSNYKFDKGKIEKSNDVTIVVPVGGTVAASEKYIFDPSKTSDQTRHATYARLVKNPTYHNVNLNGGEHGTVSVDKQQTVIKETVTLSVSPDPGYAIGSLTVTDATTNQPVDYEDKGSGKYSFTMPDHDVNVSVSFDYKEPADYWAGSGTDTDPYIIATDDDWTVLTTAYDNFNDHFKLGSDVNVTAPVGDVDHSFKGVFDGNDNKLKLNLSSNDGNFAPFIKTGVENKTTVIKNLIVTGNISFGKKTGSALVAENTGTLTIENCRVDATLTSTIDGAGNIGGFVGENTGALTFKGCLFAGELLGANTTDWGGFVGLGSAAPMITDCAFVPSKVTFKRDNSATFVCGNALESGSRNFYYGDFCATNQGKLGHIVSCTNDIKLDFDYDDTNTGDPVIVRYNVSGIDTFNDDNIFVDGNYMANDEEDIFFKIKKPENYIVGKYTYARVGENVDNDLDIWYANYYQIEDVKTDISVSTVQTHRLVHHPKVDPGVNNYGCKEYWECTITDCDDLFSDKNAAHETSMAELIIPPTNVCRENSIFSVGEDIFFDEEATVFVAAETSVVMQKDSIGVVGYNSETEKLTFNNADVANYSTDSSKEFTGKFIVRKDGGGKFQFFPLYHDKNALPYWDWNGHYSAKAELTGFAYYFSGWNDVDYTQTIDAQITYADTEPESEYSESERVYTATAVTPGVTFTDERRETLSPKYRHIEGGKVYSIDDHFCLQHEVKIKCVEDGAGCLFSEGESLIFEYDKEEQKLLLSYDTETENSLITVAEIHNDENNNYTFTGYFFVEEDVALGHYKLIPIYHGNFGEQGVSWAWSDDKLSAETTVNGNWYTYDDNNHNYMDYRAEPFSVTIDAEVTLDYSAADEGGIAQYDAKATLCDCVFTDRQYVFIEKGVEELAGYSISLDGDIGVNFYMELSDELLLHKNTAYMQFRVPSGDSYSMQRMPVSKAETKTAGGKTYYVFKCKVAAKDMATKITAQIINGNDAYNMYSYSVRDYAQYLLDHKDESASYNKAAPLVEAMLNYGAAAQLYFGNNTGDLSNNILDEEEQVYRPLDEITITQSSDTLPEGVFQGATLSLKSRTTLSIYFNSETPLTFSCEGMTVEKAEANGSQIARIRDIPAVNLSDTFTLTVDGMGEVQYSPLNYCKLVLETEGISNKLKDVAGSLYMYSYLADYFFGKKTPDAED